MKRDKNGKSEEKNILSKVLKSEKFVFQNLFILLLNPPILRTYILSILSLCKTNIIESM